MATKTAQSDSVGAPSKLTEEITDKICSALRMTAYVDTAVAHAGVSRGVYYKWLKRGHDEKFRLAQYEERLEHERLDDKTRKRQLRTEEVKRRKLRTKEHRAKKRAEARYVVFVDAIDLALADGELGALSVIASAAKGGAVIHRTTTRLADGSTTTVEKFCPAVWNAAAFMLERRHPNKYAKLERREISGPDAGPVEVKSWSDAVKEAFDDDSDPEKDFEGA